MKQDKSNKPIKVQANKDFKVPEWTQLEKLQIQLDAKKFIRSQGIAKTRGCYAPK